MKESINFDQILENNIGIGKYQLIVLIILSMIDIVSGIELILMSLSLPLIQIQWGISLNGVKNLVGIFYFGMIFGFLLTGNVSDKYGRRFTILIASIMQVSITIGFYFTTEFYSLLILRGLLGFSFAFSLSLTSPMIAEITPLAQRGKSQILLNFSISLGKVFGCILAYFFISNDITQGNWQLMIITSSIFPCIVILGTILYIKESPRFLIINGQGKKSIEIIQFMIKENKGEELSEDQINYLQTQNATQVDNIQINLTSLIKLFHGKQITPALTPYPNIVLNWYTVKRLGEQQSGYGQYGS